MNTRTKILTIATASLGLAFTATPAFAGSDVPTRNVSTAGLDLASPAGQEILDRRIDRAAREVCGSAVQPVGTRVPSFDSRKCVAKARASAKSQMATIIADQQRGG